MLWFQAADGTLINLQQLQEVVIEFGVLYAVGLSGRHKVASTEGGNNLPTIITAIKTALGASYTNLGGGILPELP